jgi:archaetidylinositol phosphate synthase
MIRWSKYAFKLGLTPNQVSVIGLILAFLSGFFYYLFGTQISNLNYLFVAPILLLASGFCDLLDGSLAREYYQQSKLGGFLDSLLDRYSDIAILSGIILGGLCDLFWGLIAMTGSFLVSYSRSRSEGLGVNMMSIGIAERAERLLIIALFSFLDIIWSGFLNLGIYLLAFLTSFTVIQRVNHFIKNVKSIQMNR